MPPDSDNAGQQDRIPGSAARDVMLKGRYGEPTDTYTWELVVDRCLHVLRTAGYVIVRAPDAD